MTDLRVTKEMLETAYDEWRAANQKVTLLTLLTLLTLVALAERARARWPEAAKIDFEWSDQGPYLVTWGVRDADGNALDDENSFDDGGLPCSLAEDSEGVWSAFMKDDPDPTDVPPAIAKFEMAGRPAFTLPIDDALAIDLSEVQ